MTMSAAAPSVSFSRFSGREAALWTTAAATVLAMHLAVAYAFQATRPAEPEGGPPPALMIELAPLPVAPAAEEEAFVPDTIQPEQAEPVDDAEKVAEAEPVTEAEPEPIAEEAEPVMEELQPEEVAKAEPIVEQEPLEEVIPDVVEVETPEVAVPLPQPRPVVEEKPKAEKKPVEKPKKEKKQPAAKPVVTAKVAAEPAPKAAAQRQTESVASSGVSPARWQQRLSAWLNRHKRYPSGSRSKREEGTVQVAFTIDPTGRITSSRITRSSGSPALDQAALDMLRRASPVPAPPKEIAKPSMPISLPVAFDLR